MAGGFRAAPASPSTYRRACRTGSGGAGVSRWSRWKTGGYFIHRVCVSLFGSTRVCVCGECRPPADVCGASGCSQCSCCSSVGRLRACAKVCIEHPPRQTVCRNYTTCAEDLTTRKSSVVSPGLILTMRTPSRRATQSSKWHIMQRSALSPLIAMAWPVLRQSSTWTGREDAPLSLCSRSDLTGDCSTLPIGIRIPAQP